jgi:nucleoside-diphosphate-sugar epimerase
MRGWTLIELGRTASWSQIDPTGLDAVVNCAGVGMDSSRRCAGTDLIEANVVLAVAAAQMAIMLEIPLIHFGSAAQLSDHLVRTSPYVRSKHLASAALALLAETDGLSGVELLPHIVYGDPLPGSVGVISAMIRTMAAGQAFGLKTPTVRRDFVHRDDVGEAAAAAVEWSPPFWASVEIGTGIGHSLSETAEIIGELLGLRQPWRHDPSPGRDWTDDLIADPLPAMSHLNFRAQRQLNEGLADLVGRAMRGMQV